MTVSGWVCDHLPYIVEFDMWGGSGHPGTLNAGEDFIWGYGEITWFGQQPNDYRAYWLKYAWDWVRTTDPNGYVEMPGLRGMAHEPAGKYLYQANTPSAALPDGFGDEETIKQIWAGAA